MTYCVGMLLDEGLVMAADTRTNAGVDNVGKFKKLHTWQKPGESLFVLLTAGNLAVTQSVVSLVTEGTESKKGKSAEDNLFAAKTMLQAVGIVGRAIREIKKIEGEALSPTSDAFASSYIFGGQIGKERPRLFQLYAEGNFIEASTDTPFFQIGEHKYGKPILDRVAQTSMHLGDAAKLVLLCLPEPGARPSIARRPPSPVGSPHHAVAPPTRSPSYGRCTPKSVLPPPASSVPLSHRSPADASRM
jgi:putative proteasome-type protease